MRRTRLRRQGPRGRRRQVRLAKLRPILLQRAGGRCEHPVCRRRAPLDLHHVIKRSRGGKDIDNLVCLCRACHEATDLPHGKGRLEIRWMPALSWFVFTLDQGDPHILTVAPHPLLRAGAGSS